MWKCVYRWWGRLCIDSEPSEERRVRSWNKVPDRGDAREEPAEQELAKARAEKELMQRLNAKEQEINSKETEINRWKTRKTKKSNVWKDSWKA